jgi:hypothetical protein
MIFPTAAALPFCYAVITAPGLAALPALPSSLRQLKFDSNRKLRQLSGFPASLTSLQLRSCKALTGLGKPPAGLQQLDLADCLRFELLPKLPRGLTALDVRICSRAAVQKLLKVSTAQHSSLETTAIHNLHTRGIGTVMRESSYMWVQSPSQMV